MANPEWIKCLRELQRHGLSEDDFLRAKRLLSVLPDPERIAILSGDPDEQVKGVKQVIKEGLHDTAQIKTPSTPKTIDIIIPPVLHGDEPDSVTVTFYDDGQLLEYLRSNQVVGLKEVTQGSKKMVREVAELDPSITYTHAPSSKEAFARILGEARHLQQAREDELGRAMLAHLKSVEPHEGYELKEDLRLQLASDGKVREDDVVIVGKSKAWIGSHKTYAKGAKPVVEVAARAKDLANISTQLPAQVLPAFMVERVDADAERSISKACKDLHVLRFHRSGHAIKVVSRMGAAGRQLLRKF